MNMVCQLNYFSKKMRLASNFLSKEFVKIEMTVIIFVDKIKLFSLKGRRDEDDFEN